MHQSQIPIHWPVDEVRQSHLYFYQEPIDPLTPDNHVTVAGRGPLLMLGGYSYLGLNGHPDINRAALDAIAQYGTGTLGVRFLAGTLDIHQRLERRVAEFKGAETAVAFSSGFLANVSTIASVVARQDVVICDKLNHASIVDGCQISQAEFVRFRHNDMEHLEKRLAEHEHRRLKLVVVDAVFSMDGDIINLPEVSRLCRRYGALLMVDEAHSLGVLGDTGHGIEEHFGLPPCSVDIKMGTFSKAIPSVGGYAATSTAIAEAIRHRARGYIYSASLPAPSAAAAIAALDVIESEPERVRALHENIRCFGCALRNAGLSFGYGQTAIFPVMCGEDWTAFRMAGYCQSRGIYVQAIPHPVVPKGAARLRACVTATHKTADLEYSAVVMKEGAESLGLLQSKAEAAGSSR